MRAAATRPSLEFVSSAYAVNGNAAHASASPTPSRSPAMRHPSANMPAMQRMSNRLAAPWAAPRSSHLPSHGWVSSNGTYAM